MCQGHLGPGSEMPRSPGDEEPGKHGARTSLKTSLPVLPLSLWDSGTLRRERHSQQCPSHILCPEDLGPSPGSSRVSPTGEDTAGTSHGGCHQNRLLQHATENIFKSFPGAQATPSPKVLGGQGTNRAGRDPASNTEQTRGARRRRERGHEGSCELALVRVVGGVSSPFHVNEQQRFLLFRKETVCVEWC